MSLWSWMQDVANKNNASDPYAGYVVDPVTAQNFHNEGNPHGQDYSGKAFNDGVELLNEMLGLKNNNKPGGSGKDGVLNKIPGVSETEDDTPTFWEKPTFKGAAELVNQTAMDNNEWSAQQAQIQRDWQEYMSNTAHQREVADLQAAGLNPVLSAGGTGASTPSGAMGQTDTGNTAIVGQLAMKAIDGLTTSAVGASAVNSQSPGFWNWYQKNARTLQTAANTAKAVASVVKMFA